MKNLMTALLLTLLVALLAVPAMAEDAVSSASVADFYADAALTGERRVPYLLNKPDGAPLDFSFLPITQYGMAALGREMESFSALLDAFYAERDAVERTRQRAHDLLRLLTNAYDRTARKLEHQRAELKGSADRDQ